MCDIVGSGAIDIVPEADAESIGYMACETFQKYVISVFVLIQIVLNRCCKSWILDDKFACDDYLNILSGMVHCWWLHLVETLPL